MGSKISRGPGFSWASGAGQDHAAATVGERSGPGARSSTADAPLSSRLRDLRGVARGLALVTGGAGRTAWTCTAREEGSGPSAGDAPSSVRTGPSLPYRPGGIGIQTPICPKKAICPETILNVQRVGDTSRRAFQAIFRDFSGCRANFPGIFPFLAPTQGAPVHVRPHSVHGRLEGQSLLTLMGYTVILSIFCIQFRPRKQKTRSCRDFERLQGISRATPFAAVHGRPVWLNGHSITNIGVYMAFLLYPVLLYSPRPRLNPVIQRYLKAKHCIKVDIGGECGRSTFQVRETPSRPPRSCEIPRPRHRGRTWTECGRTWTEA